MQQTKGKLFQNMLLLLSRANNNALAANTLQCFCWPLQDLAVCTASTYLAFFVTGVLRGLWEMSELFLWKADIPSPTGFSVQQIPSQASVVHMIPCELTH